MHITRATRTRRIIRVTTEAPDGGDTTDTATDAAASQDANEQDWKSLFEDMQAKYDAMRKHSREWEKRAKDNKADADELTRLRETNTDLETRLAAIETQRQQAEWREQAAKEHDVPADLLRGDSLEAIQTHAEQLAAYLHPKPKGAALADPGRTPDKPAKREAQRDYVRSLFGDK